MTFTMGEIVRLIEALEALQAAETRKSCSRDFEKEEADEKLKQKLLGFTSPVNQHGQSY